MVGEFDEKQLKEREDCTWWEMIMMMMMMMRVGWWWVLLQKAGSDSEKTVDKNND